MRDVSIVIIRGCLQSIMPVSRLQWGCFETVYPVCIAYSVFVTESVLVFF